jgi:hypothetical protein
MPIDAIEQQTADRDPLRSRAKASRLEPTVDGRLNHVLRMVPKIGKSKGIERSRGFQVEIEG